MKELRIKVTKQEQLKAMAKDVIEKFKIEGVDPDTVVSVKFFFEEDTDEEE